MESFARSRLGRLFALPSLTGEQVVRLVAWPLAVVTALDVVLLRAFHGDITDDFKPVHAAVTAFLHHRPVYGEHLEWVDPHYLYPPGGTLLLSPLGLVEQHTARYVFIVVNALALIAATALLLRIFGYTSKSVVAPICYFAVFASESTINTLTFGNINGLTFLAEVAFLLLLLNRRDIAAGIVLGVTITIKPTLAPLLLIAAARRQWATIAAAIAVPLAITAAAWPFSADPTAYFRRTLPYSMQARDYFNSSIVGNALYYGISSWMSLLIRALFAAAVAISLWLLYRYYRHDDVFFVCTATGILMTAEFLLSSLGQQYYSMFILPLLMTVVLPNSVVRNWPAWLAVFGFMTYDKWLLGRWPAQGRDLEYLRITFGWSLLLIVAACVLADRYLTARRDGRLPDLDPVGPAPVTQSPW
ncbi:glycosyltransferase family 87 protein [Nocardia terpenica]|uniref:glycosyltransferase family 87 protein n=1 Tax=Nocardia terpenica TaxID=455432 RepID=UPI001E5414DC|nr:glycosyltransferase family 87 protein [Nocardia terpenica]